MARCHSRSSCAACCDQALPKPIVHSPHPRICSSVMFPCSTWHLPRFPVFGETPASFQSILSSYIFLSSSSSFFFFFSSCPLFSFSFLSSVFCLLSSVFCLLSSVFCLLSCCRFSCQLLFFLSLFFPRSLSHPVHSYSVIIPLPTPPSLSCFLVSDFVCERLLPFHSFISLLSSSLFFFLPSLFLSLSPPSLLIPHIFSS